MKVLVSELGSSVGRSRDKSFGKSAARLEDELEKERALLRPLPTVAPDLELPAIDARLSTSGKALPFASPLLLALMQYKNMSVAAGFRTVGCRFNL